jgi:hypothetical protein
MRNILLRRQAYLWRNEIAASLLSSPVALPRWRWTDNAWPVIWERLRNSSLFCGLYEVVRCTASTLRQQWRSERRLMPNAALSGPLHHFLIVCALFVMRRSPTRVPSKSVEGIGM